MTQFLRDEGSDSEEVLTPLMLDRTYLSRNFATLGPFLTLQPPCLAPSIGSQVRSFSCRSLPSHSPRREGAERRLEVELRNRKEPRGDETDGSRENRGNHTSKHSIFWSYLFINHLFAIRIPDRGLTQGKELMNGGFYYGLC